MDTLTVDLKKAEEHAEKAEENANKEKGRERDEKSAEEERMKRIKLYGAFLARITAGNIWPDRLILVLCCNVIIANVISNKPCYSSSICLWFTYQQRTSTSNVRTEFI